jgi:hypothetical protein
VRVVEFSRVKVYLPPVEAVKVTFGDRTVESVTFTYSVLLRPAAGVAVNVTPVAVPAGELIVADAGLKVSAAGGGGGGEEPGALPPPPPHPVSAKRATVQATTPLRAALSIFCLIPDSAMLLML